MVPLCTNDVYVELPAEAEVQEDERCKLIYWLYGCRPAAQAWEEHHSAVLEAVGFKRLVSCSVAFCHQQRDLAGVVHGDDLVLAGLGEDLDFVDRVLKEHYELKVRGRLGSGEKDRREIDILGREIRWHEWGLAWEGDDRHRKLVMEHLGLDETSKVLMKNGCKEDETKEEKEPQKLDPQECKAYRMLAARMNFMSQDNPAIQLAAKEVCRKMANPTAEDYMKAKRWPGLSRAS